LSATTWQTVSLSSVFLPAAVSLPAEEGRVRR
jgi:hypothetical protein